MAHRGTARPTALGSSVLAGVLLLVALISACGSPPPAAAVRIAQVPVKPVAVKPVAVKLAAPGSRAVRTRMLAVSNLLGACEGRLERGPHSTPTVAIVGASYTAGVGPGVSSLSWAAVLARTLRWNAIIYGVPGVGYVAKGDASLGPVSRMVGAERLRVLDPALVIVQAGHDDAGVSPAVERRQVERAIATIRAQAPHARIALLTVFTKPATTNWLEFYLTDRAIVTAARAADPNVIIMDPFTGRWKFAHYHGTGLHPTAAGDAQIARRVAAILRSRHIVAAAPSPTAPVTCRVSVGVGPAAVPGPVSRDA